jgi:hypothetical protein
MTTWRFARRAEMMSIASTLKFSLHCPEYCQGYYATFFFDPDGLKYEFVFKPMEGAVKPVPG